MFRVRGGELAEARKANAGLLRHAALPRNLRHENHEVGARQKCEDHQAKASPELKEEPAADLDDREKAMTNPDAVHSPDADALRQTTKLLEAAIAKLPERFRVVFMLREVEGLSAEETAEALQITRETVKTRLARARRELQQELDSKLRNALQDTFTFAGSDCDALTQRVLAMFIANGRSQSS